jgi:hypothetical protein
MNGIIITSIVCITLLTIVILIKGYITADKERITINEKEILDLKSEIDGMNSILQNTVNNVSQLMLSNKVNGY